MVSKDASKDDESGLPLLLGVSDVARLLGVGLGTVRKWPTGHAPVPPGFPKWLKIGRRPVIRRADLEKWIAGLGATEQEPVHAHRRRGRSRKGAGA